VFSIKNILKKTKHFIIYRVLHIDDTPHRIALGIGLGFFVAWTPTIGFQMALVLLLATAFKANRLVGLPIVWISNPFTIAPIFFPNYWIGRKLLSLFGQRPELTYTQLKDLFSTLRGPGYIVHHFWEPETWRNIWQIILEFLNISLDLWVGSLLVGAFLGIIFYIISYKLIVWYRTHHPRGRRFMLKLQRKKQTLE